MDSQTILSQVSIASPCNARWSAMKGDERVRFCELCARHVYNLSAMPADQAGSLVSEREGRICVRFYRRRDGTMLTADCPIGTQSARRRWFARMASAAALGLMSLCGGGYLLARQPDQRFEGDGGSVGDMIEWVKLQLGLATPSSFKGGMTMGEPALLPLPPTCRQAPSEVASDGEAVDLPPALRAPSSDQ
jgi:hypothetical protein